ncbi:MAG: small ribosomal subunit Rsm22 family protein [Candidatus Sulfopaludibacter sp.]|nr:small ribosomal subunit Rsm22 family protein [Candidatus Sulfopaludibacter sp.]
MPGPVSRVVDERAEEVGFGALKRAAAAMSEGYREGRVSALGRLTAAERTAAYLVTRMPATYTAAYSVLGEVRTRLGNAPVATILDVGAGTGAASLAAHQWYPEAAFTMLERDSAFLEAARGFLPDAAVLSADATTLDPLPPHDLVMAAYSLGELAKPLAHRLWQAARVALVVIEPGTPAGFSLVRAVRDQLLAAGARMAAPCPAETACPVVHPDWCHFAARVERSSLHRRLKDAQLNYEDEKFSYIALTRNAVSLPEARIVRHPRYQPGLITLEVCTPTGLHTERITKRTKDKFRAARKSAWGDVWG